MSINEINTMKNELNALREKADNLEAMITKIEKTAEPVFERVRDGDEYWCIGRTDDGRFTPFIEKDRDDFF